MTNSKNCNRRYKRFNYKVWFQCPTNKLTELVCRHFHYHQSGYFQMLEIKHRPPPNTSSKKYSNNRCSFFISTNISVVKIHSGIISMMNKAMNSSIWILQFFTRQKWHVNWVLFKKGDRFNMKVLITLVPNGMLQFDNVSQTLNIILYVQFNTGV